MESQKLKEHFSSHGYDTIQRCKKFMEPDDLQQALELMNLETVTQQVLGPNEGNVNFYVPYQVAGIKPTLGHIDHFTEFFDSNLGPDLDSSFLWGSIGILLRLVSTPGNDEALSNIPKMLKNIGYQVEAFNGYCDATEEVGDQMREVCFDIQNLLIEFFTNAVRCVRGECQDEQRGKKKHDDPWQLLDYKYATSQTELRDMLARVEKLDKINASAKHREHRNSTGSSGKPQIRCWMLSPTKISGFFGRIDVFDKIVQALEPGASNTSFRPIALFGLQGIGKSAIAARYAEARAEAHAYNAVFWVCAEKMASLRQSFTDIALRLKLPGAQQHNHDENLISVQDWFQSTDCKWLVIYDNVEWANLLMPFWPGASHGRAIITTRNHSLALRPAASGLEILSWDAQGGSDFLLFILKQNIGADIESETNSAYDLSKRLSGHALAIEHMAGLIHERSWPISEFMKLYLKNPRRAHETELQVLWNISFRQLTADSLTFWGIISFLMPDVIPQSLFELEAHEDNLPEELAFGLTILYATKPLLATSLIKRNKDTRIFTTHRMVQTQFKFFLTPAERQTAFDTAVTLIYLAFPKQDDQQTQLYDQWTQCNRYLQHVLRLKECFSEEIRISKNFKASWKFCELLNECQRYLYESNSLEELEDVCEVNLIAVKTLEDKSDNITLSASILSHQANLYESIGKVHRAIELNKQAYEMRLHEEPLKQGLLAGFESNLGYNYNTANYHKSSLMWFKKARERWLVWSKAQEKKPDWPSHMKKNMARCLVYLNDLVGARELLNTSIAEFKSAKPLNWAMIAYAYQVLGTIERREGNSKLAEASFIEAQNLWLKGDQTRLHPFNAGCIYKTGVACLDQGKVEAAVKHLRDSVEVTKVHRKSMPVEHARALFKLSEALIQENYDGSEEEARRLREEAESYLREREPNASDSGTTEDAYDRFVPIFWR